MIADINRVVQILNGDIAAEEEQARIFDRSRVDYPIPRQDAGRAPGTNGGRTPSQIPKQRRQSEFR
jgi:hypothetical protein